MFDPSGLAVLPAVVPELPRDFRETSAIKRLRQLLLSSGGRDGKMSVKKVGFWGMGGIGKTVTSTALFRDEQVRTYFDQIVFLPLGQTPNVDKLRGNFYSQITGLPLKLDYTEEQKIAEIRKATEGRKILLYLDDIWAEEHAKKSACWTVIRRQLFWCRQVSEASVVPRRGF